MSALPPKADFPPAPATFVRFWTKADIAQLSVLHFTMVAWGADHRRVHGLGHAVKHDDLMHLGTIEICEIAGLDEQHR